MLILFAILVILASVILGMIVLVQNPKGGGLSGTFGGVSNQLMGVKQTTDVLEKGTWIFAAIIGVLCLTSALFITSGSGGSSHEIIAPTKNAAPAPLQQPAGGNTVPLPGTTTPVTNDSTK